MSVLNGRPWLLASGASEAVREGRPFRLLGEAGTARVLEAAAAGEGEAPKLPTFEMVAYNGGPMYVGYYGPVVVDLEGVSFASPIRVLRDHDIGQVVGHGEASVAKGKILASGVISGAGEAAREIAASGKNGFPWQSSIGMDPATLVLEDVRAGASTKVNGRTVKGPITVVRSGVVREISFVALGADGKTSGSIAASAKETDMDPKFLKWLQGKGIDPAGLDDARVAGLKAEYDAELAAAAGQNAGTGDGAGDTPPPEPPADPLQAARSVLAVERTRVASIEHGYMGAVNASWCSAKETKEKIQALRASAIAEGWTEAQFNAEVLKASYAAVRPVGAGLQRAEGGSDMRTIEAGMCLAFQRNVGLDDAALVRQFGEPTVQAAAGLRRLHLGEFIELCAQADGVQLPRGRGSDAWIRAAFSSTSLPGILSNLANKSLLSAYQAVASAARRVCRIGRVNDFKSHTRYRLTGNMTFQKVAPGGEIPHGELGEQSFSQKADTYGIMGGLTRQDLRNDDMGALLGWSEQVGRGAAISIEELFFTLLLANTGSFFGSGNANIYANAAAGLGDAALTIMVQMMADQVDTHGKPIAIEPAILLVPTALMALAERIYKSQNLVVTALGATDAAAVMGEVNVHAGKYQPVKSPYLGNTNFHANASSVDWYLFTDPNVLAAFELAFLDGIETPTIEFTQADFNTLGMKFRGYQDLGIAQMDPRAAVKADVG